MAEDKEPVEEVTVTWDATGETTNLTTTYSYMPSGCGLFGNCYLLAEAELANLAPVAITSNGVALYTVAEPKEGASLEQGDTAEQVQLADEYKNYKMASEWRLEEDPTYTVLTFDEYVAQNPLLFWRDPFDRWSTLVQNDYRPVVEWGGTSSVPWRPWNN